MQKNKQVKTMIQLQEAKKMTKIHHRLFVVVSSSVGIEICVCPCFDKWKLQMNDNLQSNQYRLR